MKRHDAEAASLKLAETLVAAREDNEHMRMLSRVLDGDARHYTTDSS